MSNSMKNIKPNYKSAYHQSYYSVINTDKYIGKYPIICRSGMEKKFCMYLDNNNLVKFWKSESFCLKYKSIVDNRIHNYYPDFLISMVDSSNPDKLINVIVKVKPAKQLQKPKEPKNKTKKSLENYKNALNTFYVNSCKISATKEFAANNGYKFILVTENDMKKFNI